MKGRWRFFFLIVIALVAVDAQNSHAQKRQECHPPGTKPIKGLFVDEEFLDTRSIMEYNYYATKATQIKLQPSNSKKPQIVFLTVKDQTTYADWRSLKVDSFISETKRAQKSWCAANTHFLFAHGMDTTKPMVHYTAIPYGRQGYASLRPKLSVRKLARLRQQAKQLGMSVDSNAFFCIATLQQ